MPKTLTHDILHAAIAGFEAQKKRIEAQIAELRAELNGPAPKEIAKPALVKAPAKAKRKLSKAGRAAIAAAAKKRWALVHAEKAKAATKKPAPAKSA